MSCEDCDVYRAGASCAAASGDGYLTGPGRAPIPLRAPEKERFLAVRGRLLGEHTFQRVVEVGIVGSDEVSRGTAATVGSDGRFDAVIPGVPSGPADVVAYYFGPTMAPSHALRSESRSPECCRRHRSLTCL